MFGRAPQPELSLFFSLDRSTVIIGTGPVLAFTLDAILRNSGGSLATDIFANVSTRGRLGPKAAVTPDTVTDLAASPTWQSVDSGTKVLSVITRAAFRLPPTTTVKAFRVHFRLPASLDGDVQLLATVGTSGCPAKPFRFVLSKDRMEELHADATRGQDVEQAKRRIEEFVEDALAVKQP
jgi:hypothetical protein